MRKYDLVRSLDSPNHFSKANKRAAAQKKHLKNCDISNVYFERLSFLLFLFGNEIVIIFVCFRIQIE